MVTRLVLRLDLWNGAVRMLLLLLAEDQPGVCLGPFRMVDGGLGPAGALDRTLQLSSGSGYLGVFRRGLDLSVRL